MESRFPAVETVTDQVLDALKRREFVYLEGPVSSGRNEVVKRLVSLNPSLVALDLLDLQNVDASCVATLELLGALPLGDRMELKHGTESETHGVVREALRRLHEHHRAVVLRLPESWRRLESTDESDERWVARARALLTAFSGAGVPFVIVADAAITPQALGLFPRQRFALQRHLVPIHALADVAWTSYGEAYESLRRAVHSDDRATPFAWQLAVGLRALDVAQPVVASALAASPNLGPLARAVADALEVHPALSDAVAVLLATRRPMRSDALLAASGVPTAHAPLLTQCLGYGEAEVRMAPSIRAQLRRALEERRPIEAGPTRHEALATTYERLDGAADPRSLGPMETRAWCEKVHHLALAGIAASARWDASVLPAPEFYWDRARHLSIVEKDHRAAADVYRRCVARFPGDDYAWHYLAFNRERSGGPRMEVEEAFREAVRLQPEHPWWHSRLVTFLIKDGQRAAARRAWGEAIASVDPDGDCGEKLALDLHRHVAEAWLRAGSAARGVDVLRPLPPSVLNSSTEMGALRDMLNRSDPRRGHEDPAWEAFLDAAVSRCGLSPSMEGHVSAAWRALRQAGGALLPLPMADRTSDGERLQFAWHYEDLYVEVEVDAAGGLTWFAQDQRRGVPEGEEVPAVTVSEPLAMWLRRVADA